MDKINGSVFRDMIRYGLANLEAHRAAVNDLNVFPVPDGDTGTNMVMTVQNGYRAIEQQRDDDLSQVSVAFANAAVFGARGNSGVILSQFFRGLAEGFSGCAEADVAILSAALDRPAFTRTAPWPSLWREPSSPCWQTWPVGCGSSVMLCIPSRRRSIS